MKTRVRSLNFYLTVLVLAVSAMDSTVLDLSDLNFGDSDGLATPLDTWESFPFLPRAEPQDYVLFNTKIESWNVFAYPESPSHLAVYILMGPMWSREMVAMKAMVMDQTPMRDRRSISYSRLLSEALAEKARYLAYLTGAAVNESGVKSSSAAEDGIASPEVEGRETVGSETWPGWFATDECLHMKGSLQAVTLYSRGTAWRSRGSVDGSEHRAPGSGHHRSGSGDEDELESICASVEDIARLIDGALGQGGARLMVMALNSRFPQTGLVSSLLTGVIPRENGITGWPHETKRKYISSTVSGVAVSAAVDMATRLLDAERQLVAEGATKIPMTDAREMEQYIKRTIGEDLGRWCFSCSPRKQSTDVASVGLSSGDLPLGKPASGGELTDGMNSGPTLVPSELNIDQLDVKLDQSELKPDQSGVRLDKSDVRLDKLLGSDLRSEPSKTGPSRALVSEDTCGISYEVPHQRFVVRTWQAVFQADLVAEVAYNVDDVDTRKVYVGNRRNGEVYVLEIPVALARKVLGLRSVEDSMAPEALVKHVGAFLSTKESLAGDLAKIRRFNTELDLDDPRCPMLSPEFSKKYGSLLVSNSVAAGIRDLTAPVQDSLGQFGRLLGIQEVNPAAVAEKTALTLLVYNHLRLDRMSENLPKIVKKLRTLLHELNTASSREEMEAARSQLRKVYNVWYRQVAMMTVLHLSFDEEWLDYHFAMSPLSEGRVPGVRFLDYINYAKRMAPSVIGMTVVNKGMKGGDRDRAASITGSKQALMTELPLLSFPDHSKAVALLKGALNGGADKDTVHAMAVLAFHSKMSLGQKITLALELKMDLESVGGELLFLGAERLAENRANDVAKSTLPVAKSTLPVAKSTLPASGVDQLAADRAIWLSPGVDALSHADSIANLLHEKEIPPLSLPSISLETSLSLFSRTAGKLYEKLPMVNNNYVFTIDPIVIDRTEYLDRPELFISRLLSSTALQQLIDANLVGVARYAPNLIFEGVRPVLAGTRHNAGIFAEFFARAIRAYVRTAPEEKSSSRLSESDLQQGSELQQGSNLPNGPVLAIGEDNVLRLSPHVLSLSGDAVFGLMDGFKALGVIFGYLAANREPVGFSVDPMFLRGATADQTVSTKEDKPEDVTSPSSSSWAHRGFETGFRLSYVYIPPSARGYKIDSPWVSRVQEDLAGVPVTSLWQLITYDESDLDVVTREVFQQAVLDPANAFGLDKLARVLYGNPIVSTDGTFLRSHKTYKLVSSDRHNGGRAASMYSPFMDCSQAVLLRGSRQIVVAASATSDRVLRDLEAYHGTV